VKKQPTRSIQPFLDDDGASSKPGSAHVGNMMAVFRQAAEKACVGSAFNDSGQVYLAQLK
jgi:hypothetical protein